MKLQFIIAEAALELVPKPLWKHPSVVNDARRRGAEPRDVLLDRSIHHSAMLKLEDAYRRGRPDLVHLTLLNVTSTPLHQDGGVGVFVHTFDDDVIEFREKVRPPKSYQRFRSLMEKTLIERPEEGLVRVHEETLPRLLTRIGSDAVVGLSVQGAPMGLEALADDLAASKKPAVVVGGFPRGHFLARDVASFDRMVRIDDRSLDAHVVAARVLYEVERGQRRLAASSHPLNPVNGQSS